MILIITSGIFASNAFLINDIFSTSCSAASDCLVPVLAGTPAESRLVQRDWPSRYYPYVGHCLEQFGPERCMFESNFPVDKVSFSYNVLYNAFKLVSKGYSAADRAAMFHDTAARIYRIEA